MSASRRNATWAVIDARARRLGQRAQSTAVGMEPTVTPAVGRVFAPRCQTWGYVECALGGAAPLLTSTYMRQDKCGPDAVCAWGSSCHRTATDSVGTCSARAASSDTQATRGEASLTCSGLNGSGVCVPYFSLPAGTSVLATDSAVVCSTGRVAATTTATTTCEAAPDASLAMEPCSGPQSGFDCMCKPGDSSGKLIPDFDPPLAAKVRWAFCYVRPAAVLTIQHQTLQAALQCIVDNGCFFNGVSHPVYGGTSYLYLSSLHAFGTCANVHCSPQLRYEHCRDRVP